MKKVLLIMLALIGLSACTSSPVYPEIIGTASLEYDSLQESYFVQIDSTYYPVTRVINKCATASEDTPLLLRKGLTVTCFKLKKGNNILFIAGQKTPEQIEKTFQRNYFCFYLLIAGIIWTIYTLRQKNNLPKHNPTPV